jgi:predicted tellurium resistance membrane protein TerC
MLSLFLAFAGSRWGRVTMTRLAYGALAFVAAKLIFEDLRHGHMEFIAGSIFLFAITLIAVPRLVRMGAQSRAALHHGMQVAGRS